MNIDSVPVLTSKLVMQTFYNITHSPMLYLLLVFMLVDFLSGSYKAAKTGQFSSKTGIDGLIKHLLVLVLVVSLKFFGRIFGLVAVVFVMTIAFSVNYLASIVENLEVVGIEIPEWFKRKLKQTQNKVDNEIVIDKNDEVVIRKNSDRKGVDR